MGLLKLSRISIVAVKGCPGGGRQGGMPYIQTISVDIHVQLRHHQSQLYAATVRFTPNCCNCDRARQSPKRRRQRRKNRHGHSARSVSDADRTDPVEFKLRHSTFDFRFTTRNAVCATRAWIDLT